MSKDLQTAPDKAKKKKKAAGSGGDKGTDPALMELVDHQSDVGNQEVSNLIQNESAQKVAETAPEDLKLPASVRWHLMSSREMTMLAAMVFSHSEGTKEPSDQMLALASVAMNQLENARTNQDAQSMFGGTMLSAILDNTNQYEENQSSKHEMFWKSALFDGEFATKADRDAAVAAIKAAEQVMLSGNPFQHEFMTFSTEAQSPMAQETNARSHTQLGKLHFWAFAEDTGAKVAEETDAEVEAETIMAGMAGEPMV
jgi:hypothetical protein